MKFKIAGVAGLAVAMSMAGAAPVTLNLTGGGGVGSFGNVLTYTSGPVTATVTSWSLASELGTFSQAATGRWSGNGLGVCNTAETTSSCGSPSHTMDNSAGKDFLLFQFNAGVDPSSVVLRAYSTGDSDLSYWTGNTSASTTLLSGQTLASLGGLGFGAQIENLDNVAANPRTASLSGVNVNALLISANLANLDGVKDYMKVSSLTVEYPSSQIPEPATMGLLGSALLGLGVLRTRRRG